MYPLLHAHLDYVAGVESVGQLRHVLAGEVIVAEDIGAQVDTLVIGVRRHRHLKSGRSRRTVEIHRAHSII